MRLAAMRAVSFCSAIPALLRKNVDNLISAIDCLANTVLGQRHTFDVADTWIRPRKGSKARPSLTAALSTASRD